MTRPFVHLRLHSEYSVVDGLVRIGPLIEAVRDKGMAAVALTDQTNMFGLIKFYTAALAAGVKPLCGCDVLVEDGDNPGRHNMMTLLVQNTDGYRNLTELISRAYTEKIGHGVPLVRAEWVTQHAAGLVALSGAMQGEIGRALVDGDRDAAGTRLRHWMDCFAGRFYIEVQRCGRPGEEAYIQEAVRLASEQQCPVVATNDVRFLDEEDFEAHEVRVCIHERRTLDDPRRPRHYTPRQYLRSPEEMEALFGDLPEALDNTVEIARRCTLDLTLGKPSLPDYPVPEGMTTGAFLEKVAREGLDSRLAHEAQLRGKALDPSFTETYYQRLDFELGIINQMGFPGYFLIVMEFIQWAKDNDIPVGPGRGSGAGSIVAWALRITDLDPLRYDLLFERFLNPERVSMPDFDVDFCMDGRDRVIQHVAELYGKEAVSQIITFGTMAAKAVVRDVARVQGKSYGLADKLSKLIPFEPGMTLGKALELEPQLGEFINSDEDAQEIMEMARKLEGITRNVGKHAGGVVIAPTRLTDFSPLYCDDDGESLVTQFDKNDVETAGLVKFDFLGLRTLTIIDWAVGMINDSRQRGAVQAESDLDINAIDLADESVYSLLQRAETTAVFQLESRGMKELIRRLLPNNFEDIIALVALFRPGPLQSGMVDDFINRKHGRASVDYPHPDLEPVLSNTYGVILYQEQVMQIAQVLANYSLGGADMLRRAMGKKKQEEMDRQREIFLAGAADRGLEAKLAGYIFDLMEKFAGYGFNKSHSAAYALVSYQTAWLKTHYPAFYMAAVLSADMQQTEKVVTLIEECRQMDLPIVPPDVNMGGYNFTVNDQGEIVYGLGAIKGLGEGPIASITEARHDGGAFSSLLDFCQRVDGRSVNKRAMEALIRSGALDCLAQGDVDERRARLMEDLAGTIQAADQTSRNQAAGVSDLFGDIAPPAVEPAGMDSRNRVRPWTQRQRLAAEKETLGLYLSGHPVDEYLGELASMTRDRLANLKPVRERQTVAGLVVGVRTMRSQKGDMLAFVTLDDRSARLEVSLPPRVYEKYREQLHTDTILVIECQVSVDDYSGGLRGRAEHVYSLQEARQGHVRLLLLRSPSPGRDFSERLAALLTPYRVAGRLPEPQPESGAGTDAAILNGDDGDAAGPAGCPVVVEYMAGDVSGRLRLGEEWNVRLDEELVQELRQLVGARRVELVYRE
ncbi:MAG: DNA polymerase III subunit alpha [Pseudohongiellaceae bacterium]